MISVMRWRIIPEEVEPAKLRRRAQTAELYITIWMRSFSLINSILTIVLVKHFQIIPIACKNWLVKIIKRQDSSNENWRMSQTNSPLRSYSIIYPRVIPLSLHFKISPFKFNLCPKLYSKVSYVKVIKLRWS